MTGDVWRFAASLARLARIPEEVSADAATGIQELLLDQYAAGTDPFLRAWKALAPSTIAKGRHPPPGTETFVMRDSTKATAMPGGGVSFDVGPAYATYYDRVRPIFPRGNMPAGYYAIIRAALKKRATAALEGGA